MLWCNCSSHGWRVLHHTGFAYFCLNKSKACGRQMQNNLTLANGQTKTNFVQMKTN
jgi:hypothetical protein